MALEPLRATVYDLSTGNYLRRIPVTSASYGKDIGSWGNLSVKVARTASAKLPLLRSLVQPYRTLLVLTRGTRVLQSGPVVGRPFEKAMEIKAEGYGAFFRKRLVLSRELRGVTIDGEVLIDEDNPAPEWVMDLRGSYVDIASALLEETNEWDPLPITLPPVQGGNKRRVYYGYDFATVEERLLQIMRLENGPELRFRGELTAGGIVHNFEGATELRRTTHRWNTAIPGDQCTIGKMDDDGSDIATEMWMLGGRNDDILVATRGDDGRTRIASRNSFTDPRYMRPEAWTTYAVSVQTDTQVPGRVENVQHNGAHLSAPTQQDSFIAAGPESTTSFQFGMQPGKVYEFSAEGSVRREIEDEMPPEWDALGETVKRTRARAIVVHTWDTALNGGAGGYVLWHSPQVPNVEGSNVRVSVRVGLPETVTGAFVRYYLGGTSGEIVWSKFQMSEVSSFDPDTRWSDYFWGGKPGTGEYLYSWAGTPDASASIRSVRADAPSPLLGYPLLQVADTSHSTVSEVQTLREYLRGAIIRNARTQEVIDVWVSAEEDVEPGDWADVRTDHPLYGQILLPLKVVGVSGNAQHRVKLACRIRNGETI